MLSLDLPEQDALRRIIADPLCASAIRKFLLNQEEAYTLKSRNCQTAIPESVDQQVKSDAMSKQYAVMAKAYGTVWPELEKAAGR